MRPPWLAFRPALQGGYLEPLRSEAYKTWVRTLPCATCGRRGLSECNHVVGYGFKPVGGKTDDFWVFPQCRECHELITVRRRKWEELYGEQWQYVALTMLEAIHEGVLVLA